MARLRNGTVLVLIIVLLLPSAAFANSTTEKCQVVVYGDSLGGVAMAVTTARQGVDTCLLANVGYSGGQATAAGVSTMDEGHLLLRESGLYAELVDDLIAKYGFDNLNKAYFASSLGANTIAPDPASLRNVLDSWLQESGVRVFPGVRAESVVHEDGVPVGIVGSDGVTYYGLVGAASESQELFPMVNGLAYVAGNGSCVQDITWTVVLNWYEDGIPDDLWVPANVPYQLRKVYSAETVEGWLAEFRDIVTAEGLDNVRNWNDVKSFSLNFAEHSEYRGTMDLRFLDALMDFIPIITRTGINWANDSGMSIRSLVDKIQQREDYRRAQSKTWLFMWYLRHEMGDEHWAIADDLGYETVTRPFNNPMISDRLEPYFPLLPYVREGLRLGNMSENYLYHVHLKERGQDTWGEQSVMIGAYFTDTHKCDLPDEEMSGYGLYDVPLGIFIPNATDNFIVALPRAGGVDRAAASSLRMQPTELLGGQVAGVLAALAVEGDVQPRQVHYSKVRKVLKELGAIVDVPR